MIDGWIIVIGLVDAYKKGRNELTIDDRVLDVL